MAQVIDITVDQNQDETITLNDANAGGDEHLIQFFNDDKNIFNIASDKLGGDGDLAVNDGVSYVFDVTAEQALLLDGVNVTYKHISNDSGSPVLQNSGDVTVTPLSGSTPATQVPFQNADRRTTKNANYSLTQNDDVVYGTPANLVEIDFTLPDEETMPGKEYEIKNLGQGTISVKDSESNELVNLATGESVLLRSNGSGGWEDFYKS